MAARGQLSAGRKSDEGRSTVLTLMSLGNPSIRILTYTTFLGSPCRRDGHGSQLHLPVDLRNLAGRLFLRETAEVIAGAGRVCRQR